MRSRAPLPLVSFAGLLSAAFAAPAREPETVTCVLDLLGWQRAGAVTVRTPELTVGGPAAVLDGDPRTVARSDAPSADFALEFRAAQMLRRVSVVPSVDGPSRVTLTVVEQNGRRYQAGSLDVAAGAEASFRFSDASARSIEARVERADGAPGAGLADIVVEGRLQILSLAVEGAPDTLPEGAGFPVRVSGRDSLGGRPDLTELATIVVQPAAALSLQAGRATARVQGPVSLEPRLGALSGPIVPLLITPLDPPPPPPVVLPGTRVVELHLAGEPPFEIFRREAGEKVAVSLGRSLRPLFHDTAVQPGTAYSYSARRLDLLGNALTAMGPESRGRTHARLAAGERELGRVPLLLAIFVDSLQPGERERLLASVSAARLFAWRHSLGRIVLDPVVLDVPGPVPVTSGPTMVAVEARLRELGVADDHFPVVAAFSPEFEGDYSGFRLFDDSLGLLLRGTDVPTPRGALGPEPSAAWSLLHELHHAGAGLLLEAGGEELPTGHPDQDFGTLGLLGNARGRPFTGGEAWDEAALLLAGYDGWSRLGAPWVLPIEVLDTDGDGLPDDDGRVPLDEARLGTNPTRADTDGDGVADFTELATGLYRGTSPLSQDTDGDGLSDALDPWPTSNFAGVIPFGRAPRPIASLPTSATPDAPATTLAACWSGTALTLEVTTDEPCDVFVDLDGSGPLGRWESDVNTGSPESPAGDCWCGPHRLALRAHTPPLGVFIAGFPVRNALVATEHSPDGRIRLTAVLPAALGPGDSAGLVPANAPAANGLRLKAGTVLGLAITLRPSRAPEPLPFEAFAEDSSWWSLFETHHFVDATLQE